MNPDQKQIDAFKSLVIEASNNPSFIHHPWFVKYHLDIVDSVAKELLTHYPEANKQLVEVLVWIHDYGKALDFDNQYQMTLTEGRKALSEIGFSDEFTNKVITYMQIMDRKMEIDLHDAPIEVQIVSSADGCSHYVGPFMALWWWENSKKPFEELMADTRRKADKDWNRKIVLPEARQAFESRYVLLCEQSGEFPDKYLQ